MACTKRIRFDKYSGQYKDSRGVIFQNSDTLDEIHYDGRHFTFSGKINNNGPPYEFIIECSFLFREERFSWVEYSRGNRVKIFLDEENLSNLEKATRGI